MCLARGVVVGAKRRRHVHDSTAVFGRDKLLADDDLMRAVSRVLEPVEWPPVAASDEIATAQPADDLPSDVVILTEHRTNARFREN